MSMSPMSARKRNSDELRERRNHPPLEAAPLYRENTDVKLVLQD